MPVRPSFRPATPEATAPSDGQLVARARAGDSRAFTALYRRHARYVAGVTYRLLGEATELEDLVQETFVAAARSLDQLRDEESVRPWLVTIAVRHVHRLMASRRRANLLAQLMLRTPPPPPALPDLAEAQGVYSALSELSPELRIPWLLARVEGSSLQEISELVGASVSTIKRRVSRAEELIARRLRD